MVVFSSKSPSEPNAGLKRPVASGGNVPRENAHFPGLPVLQRHPGLTPEQGRARASIVSVYNGICTLCHKIRSDASAVGAVRSLSSPQELMKAGHLFRQQLEVRDADSSCGLSSHLPGNVGKCGCFWLSVQALEQRAILLIEKLSVAAVPLGSNHFPSLRTDLQDMSRGRVSRVPQSGEKILHPPRPLLRSTPVFAQKIHTGHLLEEREVDSFDRKLEEGTIVIAPSVEGVQQGISPIVIRNGFEPSSNCAPAFDGLGRPIGYQEVMRAYATTAVLPANATEVVIIDD